MKVEMDGMQEDECFETFTEVVYALIGDTGAPVNQSIRVIWKMTTLVKQVTIFDEPSATLFYELCNLAKPWLSDTSGVHYLNLLAE